VGGGSIYPTAQNFCLALRAQGVASALTTLLVHTEPQVKQLLRIPDGIITAAHIAVGYPEHGFPTRLTRDPVNEIVFTESYGTPLADA
jgi:nitroreductase